MADNFTKYKRCFVYDAFTGTTSVFKRPLLGCKDWHDAIDSSHTNMKELDLVIQEKLPLKNLLDAPSFANKGALTQACHYLYVASTKYFYKYPNVHDVKVNVLSNTRVLEAIEQVIDSRKSNLVKELDEKKMNVGLQKQTANILQDMQATVTSKCLRFCGWLFLTLLRKLCSSVTLHQGQMKILRKVLKENRPVIYLPLHYSHFDYIILSLLSFHHEFRAPFVASGNNLALPIFSYVMKRVGGFFIRRRIESGKEKDVLYRAVLHSYVTELLKRDQVLEVYIEGTRSRSGFPTKPKSGILSIAVEAVDSGIIPDVTIVPVCISYEKLIDGHFHREMMGEAKRPETFFGTLKRSFRIIFGYFGHIRVNFGAPKSLKKTLLELRSSPVLTLDQWERQINSCSDGEAGKMVGNPDSSVKALPNINFKRLTNSLIAEHFIYRSMSSRVFMSTNILAFLLIHRYRNGVSFPVLVVAFEELVNELLDRKWDVGFSGNCYDVVYHAVTLLGPDLVTTSDQDTNNNKKEDVRPEATCDLTKSSSRQRAVNGSCKDKTRTDKLKEAGEGDFTASSDDVNSEIKEKLMNGDLKISQCCNGNDDLFDSNSTTDTNHYLNIIPNIKPPYIFELAYYGNALAPVYAMESLAALAVGAVLNCRFSDIEFEFISGNEESINYVAPIQSINAHQLPACMLKEFGRTDLLNSALELSDFLRFDLILCDVTEDLELSVFEAIDRLISRNFLIGRRNCIRKRANNDDIDYNDEKEDDQMLHVNLGAIHDFIARQSILGAFIEGYIVTARELPVLLQGPMYERSFQSTVLATARERIEKGTSNRPESASSDIISHAIQSFEANKVIQRCGDDSRSIELTQPFSNLDELASYISYVSQYLM